MSKDKGASIDITTLEPGTLIEALTALTGSLVRVRIEETPRPSVPAPNAPEDEREQLARAVWITDEHWSFVVDPDTIRVIEETPLEPSAGAPGDEPAVEAVRWAVSVPDFPPLYVDQIPDSGFFAARNGSGFCLDIDGNWNVEALPSERDEAWLARHRFATREAAVCVVRNELRAQQADDAEDTE